MSEQVQWIIRPSNADTIAHIINLAHGINVLLTPELRARRIHAANGDLETSLANAVCELADVWEKYDETHPRYVPPDAKGEQ